MVRFWSEAGVCVTKFGKVYHGFDVMETGNSNIKTTISANKQGNAFLETIATVNHVEKTISVVYPDTKKELAFVVEWVKQLDGYRVIE
jgi:hypothetical protein